MMHKDAILSGEVIPAYRYWLLRSWLRTGPRVLWIMLNPSTADAENDDPTMRRVISFSTSWGFGSAAVVNLFGFRASEPAVMYRASDPIGPNNNAMIIAALLRADMVVCAWGAHGVFNARDKEVVRLLDRFWSKPVYCLGTTKNGCPKHPVRLAGDTELVRYHVG